MTTTLRVLLVLVAMVVTVRASCNYALHPVPTSCNIEGNAVPVGGYRVTSGCFNCTCFEWGTSCCGLGVFAGAVSNTGGTYTIVNVDGCDYYVTN